MGTTTTNMGLSKPTLGGDSGTWDDQINASLDVLDAHDHSTGSGVKIKPSGIDVNADLTMAGYSLTNLRAACFTAQASFATARSLWVRSSDQALVWRSASGTDYKLADSSGINVSLVGGIGGDYAAASALVYYDDTAQAYRFLEAAPLPNSWSRVQCGDVDLYEHASGISTRVRLSSPTGLAASYALTFPAALPGSTSLLQVSSAGAITASNTVANAVTFSSSVIANTSLAVGTTLVASGLITAQAGITASANQHVTVSGTGEVKHGDRTLLTNALLGQPTLNAGAQQWERGAGYMISVGGAAGLLELVVPLLAGDRVKSITVARYGDASANVTITGYVYSAGAVATSIGATTVTAPAASWSDTVIDLTDSTLAAGECFAITFNASTANIRIGNVRVVYDHP